MKRTETKGKSALITFSVLHRNPIRRSFMKDSFPSFVLNESIFGSVIEIGAMTARQAGRKKTKDDVSAARTRSFLSEQTPRCVCVFNHRVETPGAEAGRLISPRAHEQLFTNTLCINYKIGIKSDI